MSVYIIYYLFFIKNYLRGSSAPGCLVDITPIRPKTQTGQNGSVKKKSGRVSCEAIQTKKASCS